MDTAGRSDRWEGAAHELYGRESLATDPSFEMRVSSTTGGDAVAALLGRAASSGEENGAPLAEGARRGDAAPGGRQNSDRGVTTPQSGNSELLGDADDAGSRSADDEGAAMHGEASNGPGTTRSRVEHEVWFFDSVRSKFEKFSGAIRPAAGSGGKSAAARASLRVF